MWDFLYTVWFTGLYCIDSINAFSWFPGSLTFNRIIKGDVYEEKSEDKTNVTTRQYFKILKEWAIQNMTEKDISHHWWYETLPSIQKDMFYHFTFDKSIFEKLSQLFDRNTYTIEPLFGMNELYVTSKTRGNESVHSDNVFFTPHIDGPFLFVPFVSVYRILLGLNDNKEVETIFPMNDFSHVLNKGEFLGFDFSREIHYIDYKQNMEEQLEPRVTLKLHYVMYPKWMSHFGKFIGYLNVEYNRLFRSLFLHTIKPTSIIEYMNSYFVVWSTNIFYIGELHIGYKNILYLLLIHYYKNSYNLNDETMCALVAIPLYYKLLSTYWYHNCINRIESACFKRDILLYFSVSLLYMYIV
jgi:hypothetical protein